MRHRYPETSEKASRVMSTPKAEPQRQKLNFGDDDDMPAPRPDPAVIAQTTEAAGFGTSTTPAAQRKPSTRPEKPKVSTEPDAVPADAPLRRRTRRKTGRTIQFSTRIDLWTNNAIYSYADDENIPLAEVLTRAMKALISQEGREQE